MRTMRLRRACAGFLLPSLIWATLQCTIPVPIAKAVSADSGYNGIEITTEENTPSSQDFIVSPARVSLTLDPGQKTTVWITILSRTEGTFTYNLEQEDAGSDGNGSVQIFDKIDGPFPARTWIQPALQSVRLQRGQRATIPITVDIPDVASPGDHYAAVLISQSPDTDASRLGLSLVPRVGILFLLTINGTVVRDLTIPHVRSSPFVSLKPEVTLTLEATNKGTVIGAPEGTMTIRNLLGFTVGSIPIRDWYVLRGGSGSLMLRWQPPFAMGWYRASADLMVFGAPAPTVRTGFWLLPPLPIALAALTLFLCSAFLRLLLLRFEIHRRPAKQKKSRAVRGSSLPLSQ